MKKKTASNNTLLAKWEKYEVLVISLVSRLALCVRKTALTWKPQTWRLSNYDFVRELKFCSVKTIIFSLSFSKNWHTDSELCFGGNDFYIWQKQNFIFRKNCPIANVFRRAKQSNHKFDWNTTNLEEGLETQTNKKTWVAIYHQKLQNMICSTAEVGAFHASNPRATTRLVDFKARLPCHDKMVHVR